MLNIVDSVKEISENFQDWIVKNGNNPILWIGLFLAGLFIFYLAYHVLHKDN